jgi:negative regulator of sigma E activity
MAGSAVPRAWHERATVPNLARVRLRSRRGQACDERSFPDGRPHRMNNDERNSQLSAMFDGELPASECELLARRIARDEQLKRQWSRYALIGAVIREEPLRVRRSDAGTVVGSGVAASVSRGLDGEAEMAMRAAPTQGSRAAAIERWARPIAGLGIAAGVAALAVFWLHGRTAGEPVTLLAAPASTSASTPLSAATAAGNVEIVVAPPSVVPGAGRSAPVTGSREPRSYIVPPPSQRGAPGPSAQLANYVVAHSEFSGPIARRNALSALVAADGEPRPPSEPAAAAAGTGATAPTTGGATGR